jgi:hypothetical protein
VDVNSYTTRTRWELPTIEESVNIRLYHRNTGSNYILYEFYPRRLVQSDDIQAESILAINIAADAITAEKILAGTITGDRISSATTITAGSGNEVAVLNGASGILTDGTSQLTDEDGTLIRDDTWRIYVGNANPSIAPFRVDPNGNMVAVGGTFQSSSGTGARVVLDSTGLTTYNSSNVVQIEATTANNGELRAGNGVVRLNNGGIVIASTVRGNAIAFYDSTNTTAYGSIDASSSGIFIDAADDIILNTNTGSILLVGENDTTQVKLDSGTAAAPTLTDKLDTDTGMFFPTTNAVGFSTAGTERVRITSSSVNLVSGSYQVAGTNVVGSRITGWGAPSGTATRTTFATGTVTLVQLAERVKALIDDLRTHGLIND